MNSHIMRSAGETVTVVRLSADKNRETMIEDDVLCLISAVEGEYEYWKATLDKANRKIGKGDILRRNDGSEVQVLRNVTRNYPGLGEVTRLDLKDYDRQELPLQENEVDVSKSDFLPEHEFHPAISPKVESFLSQGAYDTAIFEAFKQVEIAVRKAGNYAETDIGVSLMRKAFHVDSGNLTDENQHQAEKQARSDLFAGAIGAYKNPSSHREVEVTAEEAIEMIGLASLLLRIVDAYKERTSNPST